MDTGLSGSHEGIETCCRIRQLFSLPLIFITAYTSEETLKGIQEVKADAYIVKQFMDNEVLTTIRKVIDNR